MTLTSPSSSSPSLANGFSPCASMSLAPPKDPSSSPEPRPKGSSPFMSRAFNARYLRSDRARVGRQRQRATVCARVIGPFLDIRICRETRQQGQRPITRPITARGRCPAATLQICPLVVLGREPANSVHHEPVRFLGLQTGGDDRTERRGRERSRESRVFRRSLPTAREEAAPGEGTGAENARELPAPPEGTARTIGTLRAESRNPKVSRDPAPTRLGGVDRTA